MHPIDQILEVLTGPGNDQWYGSDGRVSQIQHALQCATLAEREGASAALVTAALLHDIGHLTNQQARAAADTRVDACHENRAVRFLQQWYGPAVLEPIRLHVAAKRYLVRLEPAYRDLLSADSIRSLEVQGGTMTEAEAAAFAAEPFAFDAVALRRWDDRAKDPQAQTPPVEHFRRHLKAALMEGAA